MTQDRHAILLLVFFAVFAPLEAVCPQTLVQPGTRIRVTHQCAIIEAGPGLLCQQQPNALHGRTTGAFVALRSDTLVLGRTVAPTVELFPRTTVSRVEMYSGRRSHWLAGAGIGALTGMVTGWVAGYAATRGDETGITVAIFPVLGAMLGTSVGLCTGVAVGLFVRSDRWTPIHVWDERAISP